VYQGWISGLGGVSVNPLFPLRPTWVEINLDHIRHNLEQFQRHLGPQVQIMVVVKADGYGHGAVEVARAALSAGASSLAVAMPDEGIELRRAGIEAPVLLLGYTEPDHAPLLRKYRLTPVLYQLETARAISGWFGERGEILPVHVKVDTGMSRVGVPPGEAAEFISALSGLPGLRLEGILTHFAAADEKDSAYTEMQTEMFEGILAACRARGIEIPLVHAANSAAALQHPHSRYNLIRLGISLYGGYPSPLFDSDPLRLRPALAFKSKIIFLKTVPPGTSVSYGCTYRTAKESLIATVPAGYADGYHRALSNTGEVLVRGRRAPVVGRICMDQFMADVSGVPGAAEGDEVVLYGCQGDERISVDEVAEKLGTINYEVLCSVGKRVPRLFLTQGRVVRARDLLGEKNFT
jgi:alanine racemase